MKRKSFLFVIVFAALLAAACGTSAPVAQGAVPQGSVQQGPVQQGPIQPAPTTASGGQPASSSGSGTQVTITLADNTIASTQTTFQAGVLYTFIIKNTGNHAHNFNISTPVTATGSEDASLASALLAVTQDKLPVGGGTIVQYTFPASAIGQQLEFSCLIKRHYEDGMKLAITVTN